MNGTTAETTSTHANGNGAAPKRVLKNNETVANDLVASIDAETLLAAIGITFSVDGETDHGVADAIEELADDLTLMLEDLERTGSGNYRALYRHIARARAISELAVHIEQPHVSERNERDAKPAKKATKTASKRGAR